MRDVADLAMAVLRIAQLTVRQQQPLLQHEFGKGISGPLEQPLRLARTQAVAPGQPNDGQP